MEKRLTYFDNAANRLAQARKVFNKFMDQFYRTHGVNPGRSGYDLAIEAGSLLTNLRKRLTKFFGGDEDAPERLVFSYNVTDSLNLVIPGLIRQGRPRDHHEPGTQLRDPAGESPGSRCGSRGNLSAVQLRGFIEPDEVKRPSGRTRKH